MITKNSNAKPKNITEEKSRKITFKPNPKVLVVDDEASIRKMVKECILSIEPNVNVVECENGFSAFLALTAKKHFVLVLDLKMPCTGGEDLYEAITSKNFPKEKLPDHVLVLSGFLDKEF